MSFYPTIPQEDELDFSSSSAPSAPSNVFQYAQEQLGGSNEKSSIYPTQDISYPLPNLGSGNQGNLGGSSNYGGSGDFGNFPINSGSIDQYSQVSAPQVNNLYNNNANPNFSSYSSYSAPPIPNQSEGELEYAPPMHTIQPTQPKLPPQWVPSCIPNPQRVNYESASYIQCGKNGLFLNVNQVIHDCPVNVWTKLASNQQKWYFTKDGYIELAADRTFVLDCRNVSVGSQVVISKKRIPSSGNPVDPSVVSQKWNVVSCELNNYICNVQKPTLILELAGTTPNYDAGDLVRINSNLSVNNDHQRWALSATSSGLTNDSHLYPIGTKCYIYGPDKLYLTVKTGLLGKAKAGAQVIASKSSLLGGKSQQWTFDKDGFIVSAIDKTGNLVLDCKTGQTGVELFLNTRQFTNNLNQKWLVKQATNKVEDTDKDINLKACRLIYSQLNTNLVLDEKGSDEAVFLNFSRNSSTQLWKIKTV